MNGTTSPDPPTTEAGDSGQDATAIAPADGDAGTKRVNSSPTGSRETGSGAHTSTNEPKLRTEHNIPNGDDGGGDSEAETLIDSPVKKKEATKSDRSVKLERPPKHRIGSLPVPNDNDDENDSAAMSPAPSTVMSIERTSNDGLKDPEPDRKDDGSDKEDESNSLSSPRSHLPSRSSSLERAESEQPGSSRKNALSPNPRKRKHRASSVSLPNKRPSMEVPKRRLRGLHSEELTGLPGRSPSPNLRSHRRATSAQSAFLDSAGEIASRKRRSATQGPARETKLSRNTWEESDASSETTSHGQGDHKQPPRGVGRSTSIPGRPPGREHKRHVNKYGFTRLAEACETADMQLVREWREKDPDQLELAEFAGNKPLQIAALNGNVEVVDYLIDQGCQIDCANVDKDTPLIDAAENGHVEVVHSLLRAGVDPLRQNLKGQHALDVVTDDTDDADEIRAALRQAIEKWNSNGAKQLREEEEEMRHRAGPTKELLFMARSYENLLKLVQINDRNGVREFLDARVPVDNAIIAAAAKTGDSYLVNMLLVELPEKKKRQKPEKPLLSVLGTSHFEMVKSLTELDSFNPLYRNRQGKSWSEIAEERRGPSWRQEKEHLQNLYDQRAAMKERRSSSPVSKRDSGKRRYVQDATDEDSDDEVPQRKNGRKLMSKRDMRAARGKAASDESSDEFSSEIATDPEVGGEYSMKPPGSPTTSKRTPTRSRTKSLSAQPQEHSPRTRRSSSFRGLGDQPLPTVEETVEVNAPINTQRAEDEERRATEEAEQAEQKRKLEIKRQEEEEAEAEAAAKRAAEESARRVEAKRKADEVRREEEQRKALELRLAEEERERKEKEEEEKMVAAQRHHCEQVIASLPSPISHVLDPNSDFTYDDQLALNHLIHYFTPLQVLQHEGQTSLVPMSQEWEHTFWVLNVQAAPLLGKQGLELMFRHDVPGFQGCLADTWETRDVLTDDIPLIESLLTCLPPNDFDAGLLPHHGEGEAALAFEDELRRAADRWNSASIAKERLRGGVAVLRYVRLDDVLRQLHPMLRHASIEVRFDLLQQPLQLSAMKDNSGFVDKLGTLFDSTPCPRTYIGGKAPPNVATRLKRTTSVTMIHQK